jgi:prepilin-type N-terminal cleavage/methylation domain-containing protein
MNLSAFILMAETRVRRSGFTLIELIVALSLLALLAGVLIPVSIAQIDRLFRETEAKQLREIEGAFTASVLREKYIPAHTNWAQAVAAQMGVSAASISHNVRRNQRVFLIDPDMEIGWNGTKLPYQQNMLGSIVTNALGQVIPPVSPRILLISSLADQTLPVSSGVASSPSAFNAIWNTAEGAVPSGWPAGWAGKGDDLQIQRINLVPLFKRLTLNNHDGPQGNYSINGISIYPVEDIDGVNAFFLENTLLGLHDMDGNIKLSHVLTREESFFYDNKIWRRGIVEAPPRMFRTELTVELFLDSKWNVNAKDQTGQTNVFSAMTNYFTAYKDWASAGFPSSQQNNPTWTAAKSAQSLLHDVTVNLMNNPACE